MAVSVRPPYLFALEMKVGFDWSSCFDSNLGSCRYWSCQAFQLVAGSCPDLGSGDSTSDWSSTSTLMVEEGAALTSVAETGHFETYNIAIGLILRLL